MTLRMGALQEMVKQVAESHTARLTDATLAIEKLSKELADQRTAINQTRGELVAGRRWILAAIVGMGTLVVALQLVQLLR